MMSVVAGLDRATHQRKTQSAKPMDARVKPAHDAFGEKP
jgi:hypothetical protein